MQLVFVHHHLNTGGVTQVILNQLMALASLPPADRPRRVGVLYGGRGAGWPVALWDENPPYEVVMLRLPSVDYDEDRWGFRPDRLSDELATTLNASGFGPEDTLLHVHNHSLGKNLSLPDALRQLAQRGFRLLLQIHDFAEDFRPTNYRRLAQALNGGEPLAISSRLYPQSDGIHYATLTRRDSDILAEAGVHTDRLHVLPNPVAEFAGLASFDDVAGAVRDQLRIPRNARLVLYPVRGLRRKNVGELLLYAAISSAASWHAITRAPRNPQELPSFEMWRRLATELKLRTQFDVCGSGELAFLDALAASDALITTSVAEGFGMVFLEAWLAGRPLVGRNLPDLTREFEAAGLDFTGLRDTLEIPFGWLPDKSDLAKALSAAFRWACENYGGGLASEEETATALEQMLARSTIDFAVLPSHFQEIAIRHAANDPATARQELATHNPGLEAQLSADRHQLAEQIETNAETVRSMYSLDTIGRRLRDVYAALEASSRLGKIESLPRGESILRHFLRIERLHAIRFEE